VTTTINVHTDNELKANAQAVLADLGLDISTAVNIFLRQVVNQNAIPFYIEKQKIKKKKPHSQMYGSLRGKIQISEDFCNPIDAFEEYM